MTYTDDTAVKALKTHYEKAFEWIYNKYFRQLCLYAENLIESSETAKDIVHDIFTKLWEKSETIDITTSLKAYLYKGVHNNCLSHLTHMKVVRNHIEYKLTMADSDGWLQTNDCDNPLTKLILQEMEDKIEKAIESLPARCKEVFLLWEEGFTYEEIANKLEISTGSVAKQISRATIKLQKTLKISDK